MGSIITRRTSSGVALINIETTNELIIDDLPAPVAPATSKCGIFAKFAHKNEPSTSLPKAINIGCGSLEETEDLSTSPNATISRSEFGISIPTADLPGIGERILISPLATAYAMFLESAEIASTFTPFPNSTSYRVTVGPRMNPVTWASTSNCSNTCLSAATTVSFAFDLPFAAGPPLNKSAGGNSYFESEVRSNCIGLECSALFDLIAVGTA